jgi:hypothetical protein
MRRDLDRLGRGVHMLSTSSAELAARLVSVSTQNKAARIRKHATAAMSKVRCTQQERGSLRVVVTQLEGRLLHLCPTVTQRRALRHTVVRGHFQDAGRQDSATTAQWMQDLSHSVRAPPHRYIMKAAGPCESVFGQGHSFQFQAPTREYYPGNPPTEGKVPGIEGNHIAGRCRAGTARKTGSSATALGSVRPRPLGRKGPCAWSLDGAVRPAGGGRSVQAT